MDNTSKTKPSNKPLVSMLVPIYGVEQYIERCATSLMKQTYDNIEYVFVDDRSPDNSIVLLESVIERFPYRKDVQIIRHQTNKGLAAARNTALKYAQGEFVVHVDSDDWVESTLVEKLIEKQKVRDVDMVFVDFVRHQSHRSFIVQRRKYNSKTELVKNMLCCQDYSNVWGCLIRRSLYLQHSIRTVEGINMGEDFQVIPRLVHCASHVDFVNSPLIHYNEENLESYTRRYRADNYKQAWESRQIVHNALANIPEYQDALKIGDIYRIVETLKNSAVARDSDLYNTFRLYASELNKNYWKSLNIGDRIVLNLPNMKLCGYYVRLARWFMRFFYS